MKDATIPLNFAVLCLDCNTVSNGPRNRCAQCDSRALMALAAILNRTSAPQLTVPSLA